MRDIQFTLKFNFQINVKKHTDMSIFHTIRFISKLNNSNKGKNKPNSGWVICLLKKQNKFTTKNEI